VIPNTPSGIEGTTSRLANFVVSGREYHSSRRPARLQFRSATAGAGPRLLLYPANQHSHVLACVGKIDVLWLDARLPESCEVSHFGATLADAKGSQPNTHAVLELSSPELPPELCDRIPSSASFPNLTVIPAAMTLKRDGQETIFDTSEHHL